MLGAWSQMIGALLNGVKELCVRTQLIIVFSLFFLFSLFFSGILDGDGMSLVYSSMFLPFAQQGKIFLYRYYSQPLTYEFLHFTYALTGCYKILLYLPALFGSVGITLLVYIVKGILNFKYSVFTAVACILMFPELLITGCYVNSSAFALPFFVISIFMVFLYRDLIKSHNEVFAVKFLRKHTLSCYFLPAIAGLSAGIAVLFRLDFVLGLPLVIFLFILDGLHGNKRAIIIFLFSGLLISLIAILAGVFVPSQVISDLMEHRKATAGVVGVNAEKIFSILRTLMHPVVFVVLFLCSLKQIIVIIKEKKYRLLLVVPALLVSLYSCTHLTSPKYLLPVMCFLPILGALFFNQVSKISSKTRCVPVISFLLFALFIFFFDLDMSNKLPFLKVSTSPKMLHTADGDRCYSGYYWMFPHKLNAEKAEEMLKKKNRRSFSLLLSNEIKSSDHEWVIVSPGEGFEQPWLGPITDFMLPYYLLSYGYKLKIIDDGLLLTSDKHSVTIYNRKRKDYSYEDKISLNQDVVEFYIPYVNYHDKTRGKFLKEIYSNIEKSF